jgi:YfiH family protein
MLQKSHDGVFRSTLIDTYPEIFHGFTTKKQGDMKKEEKRKDFFTSIGVAYSDVVLQEQVHGAAIHSVLPLDRGKTIPGVDGLVYQKKEDSPLFLSVHVGDCAPLLFADPVKKIIGVAHSGWRGTAGHIAKEMVKEFQKLGSSPANIVVVCGPCICCDCYSVDLWKAISIDLEESLVQKDHMDYDKTLCTFEKKDLFYSWRRKDEPFGEIMGYIGYTG